MFIHKYMHTAPKSLRSVAKNVNFVVNIKFESRYLDMQMQNDARLLCYTIFEKIAFLLIDIDEISIYSL